jgi:hypothetical protein
MHFCRVDDYLSVSRITGGQDNILQIRLSMTEPDTVDVDARPLAGFSSTLLDENKVVSAVMEGLRQANAELGTSYWISHIRFVANDSKPEKTYSLLTQALLHQYYAGNPSLGA